MTRGGVGDGRDEQVTDTINTRTVKSNRSRLSFISIRKLNKSERSRRPGRFVRGVEIGSRRRSDGVAVTIQSACTHIRLKWPIVICMSPGGGRLPREPLIRNSTDAQIRFVITGDRGALSPKHDLSIF